MSNVKDSTDVLVVGGGMAGLAGALALRENGADVTLVEVAPAFGEVGAGLQMAPNASRVLKRWGLLDKDPDYLAVAKKINRIDVYTQAATAVGGINLPSNVMRSSTLFDGKVWDGTNPAAYANSFAMKR